MTLFEMVSAKLWESGECTGDQMEGARRAVEELSKELNLPSIGNVVILPATLDSKFTVGDGEIKTALNIEAKDNFLLELNRVKNCAVCIIAVEQVENDLLPSNGDDPDSPPVVEPKRVTGRRGRPRKTTSESQD